MIEQTIELYRHEIAQARQVAGTTTCPKAQVAAKVIIGDYAYNEHVVRVNGAPVILESCEDAGCAWVACGDAGTNRDHARHLHAEAAAIAACAAAGLRTARSTLVVTQAPCPSCALLILASRIGRVVVPATGVPSGWGIVRSALESAGVDIVIVEEE